MSFTFKTQCQTPTPCFFKHAFFGNVLSYAVLGVSNSLPIGLFSFFLITFKYMQIEDCRTRYNGDADHHQRRKKFSFPARLMSGDCFEVTNSVEPSLLFIQTLKIFFLL